MKHQNAIQRAKAAVDRAEKQYGDAIRAAAADGASIRELAKFTGLSPNTIRKILADMT